MCLCDTNVWLALTLSGHVHHEIAAAWLEGMTQPASILFCRTTQQSLLRLLTNPAVLAPYGSLPLTNAEAWGVYEALLGDDRMVLRAQEPADVEARWRQLAVRDTPSPKLWMDAYLAAFALAADCQLVTTDAAFQQFSELDLLLLQ